MPFVAEPTPSTVPIDERSKPWWWSHLPPRRWMDETNMPVAGRQRHKVGGECEEQ